MQARNKTFGIIIAGTATLALTALFTTENRAIDYQVFSIEDVSFVNAAEAYTDEDAFNDDQYEVHVKSNSAPFEQTSNFGFITHGHENALRYKRFDKFH